MRQTGPSGGAHCNRGNLSWPIRSSVSWRLAAALAAAVPLVVTGLSSAAPASPAAPQAPLSGLLAEGSGAALIARPGGPAQNHAAGRPGVGRGDGRRQR